MRPEAIEQLFQDRVQELGIEGIVQAAPDFFEKVSQQDTNEETSTFYINLAILNALELTKDTPGKVQATIADWDEAHDFYMRAVINPVNKQRKYLRTLPAEISSTSNSTDCKTYWFQFENAGPNALMNLRRLAGHLATHVSKTEHVKTSVAFSNGVHPEYHVKQGDEILYKIGQLEGDFDAVIIGGMRDDIGLGRTPLLKYAREIVSK